MLSLSTFISSLFDAALSSSFPGDFNPFYPGTYTTDDGEVNIFVAPWVARWGHLSCDGPATVTTRAFVPGYLALGRYETDFWRHEDVEKKDDK